MIGKHTDKGRKTVMYGVAACAAICGSFLARAQQARGSLATYELVPTSISTGSGTIVGNNVNLTSANATVQFNIVIFLHGSDGNATNDGVQNALGGLAATSSGRSGAFAVPTLNSNFNNTSLGASPGVQITSGSNTNIGSETAFGTAITSAQQSNDFVALSSNAPSSYTFGTSLTGTDTAMILGTTSFQVTGGTSGSVALQFLPDFQNTGSSAHKFNQTFEVDGNAYNLNGIGSNSAATTTNGIDAITTTISSAPEPGSLGILSMGALGFLVRRRKGQDVSPLARH